MPHNTYSAAIIDLRNSLKSLYDAGESMAIAREVLFQITDVSYSQSLSHGAALTIVQGARLGVIKEELLAGSPMQYATGQAFFMGRRYEVDKSVLIPRPETEELVNWVLEDYQVDDAVRILDVGTGTGCIAVSLKAERKNSLVSALDISRGALELASRNAIKNGAAIDFLQADFLKESELESFGQFDVIVSNPPYIPASEKKEVAPIVSGWEPHLALFVPDAEPLIFYQALARFGQTHLCAGGAVYCEIHRDFGQQAVNLFSQAGYKDVELRKDMSGNDRMIRASPK